MNGIVINIDPVALHLGHFELRWYSIFVVLAIIAAVVISIRESKRKGISTEEIYSLVPWALIGGIAGARLFHVIDEWETYAANPLQILALWQGGLAIWGALAGGGVATIVYSRIKHLPLGRLADTAVPGVLVAQMVGRLACIVNGDAYGSATSLPWGFIYVNPGSMIPADLYGIPTHPYPVYEILWNASTLFILLRLRRHFRKDGLVFLSYLSLYSLGRFALTFVREQNAFGGLQQAQIMALLTLVISLTAIAYFVKVKRAHEEPVI